MSGNLQKFASRVLGVGGGLAAFADVFPGAPVRDLAAIIIQKGDVDAPNVVDAAVKRLELSCSGLQADIYVVHMCVPAPTLTTSGSIYHFQYPCDDFPGLYFGYNLGIRLARCIGAYKFYWLQPATLTWDPGECPNAQLVDLAGKHPKMDLLLPVEMGLGDHSPAYCFEAVHRPGTDVVPVIPSRVQAMLVRNRIVEELGFITPELKHNVGALEEFAHKVHANRGQIGICPKVAVTHSPAEDKIENHKPVASSTMDGEKLAARYFVQHYGKNWDEEFSNGLPPEFPADYYRQCRYRWEAPLEESERNIYRSSFDNISPTASLIKKIEALHPWFYEVKIGDITVIPGIGSRQTAEQLRGRVHYRRRLLVEEVLRRYNFSGKRLLDIASNCGYWSARYAEAGATSLLAVEGRWDYVKQGRLYWDTNRFMKKGAYRFIKGNVQDEALWKDIESRSPFDFTLCAGILYHIPHYEHLLQAAAQVTREAILIDTRVGNVDNVIEEPGGWCFDAIVETRRKRIPRLEDMVRLMESLGFNTEQLTSDAPIPDGLKGSDDYQKGNRVTLLATRKKTPMISK